MKCRHCGCQVFTVNVTSKYAMRLDDNSKILDFKLSDEYIDSVDRLKCVECDTDNTLTQSLEESVWSCITNLKL